MRQRVAQILQRHALGIGRLAEFFRRRHEVAVVVDGVADHRIELRVGLRRDPGTVAPDEAPQGRGILRIRRRHQRQQHLEGHGHVGRRRMAGMNVPDRIGELLPRVLPRKRFEKLLVVVDVARDHVEIQPLCRLRLAVHEQRQRFRRRIAQPLVDGEPVALRLRNLLAVLVEEQLVVKSFRRRAAEYAADLARQLYGIDQILAGHFVVDPEREPAHRPVRLPLQLAMPAGDRKRHALFCLGIIVGDRPCLHVMRHNRHIQHHAGARTDRQERRIARRALFAQGRQHHRHHLVDALQHAHQRRVEFSRSVIIGRARELVVESERVEKRAQPRVVVGAETVMGAERIGHPGQRLAEVLFQHLLVRHVVGYLAQAVHVVGERDQPGPDLVLGEHTKRMAHHGGARDLAESADMRQARRPVAGREQHLVLWLLLQPRDDRLRLLERPGVGLLGERAQLARTGGKVDGGHFKGVSRSGGN